MHWEYKSILLRFTSTPQEFDYLFNKPVHEVSKFNIKKQLGAE